MSERGPTSFLFVIGIGLIVAAAAIYGLLTLLGVSFVIGKASAEGGMEIEDISADRTGSSVRSTVEPAVGLQHFQARESGFALDLDPALMRHMERTLLG